MNRRGDTESAVHTLLIVILAAGILVLLFYVTTSMFHIKLSFSG